MVDIHSKRWIVDRATLRQARADDLQYVDDPDHLDFLSIFFTNGEPYTPGSTQTLNPSSYNETRKEAQLQTARHCNSHCLFSKILHQEFVL
jgi:SpoVK/Ycf46/Vps4 family AAA+-type ATPase